MKGNKLLSLKTSIWKNFLKLYRNKIVSDTTSLKTFERIIGQDNRISLKYNFPSILLVISFPDTLTSQETKVTACIFKKRTKADTEKSEKGNNMLHLDQWEGSLSASQKGTN